MKLKFFIILIVFGCLVILVAGGLYVLTNKDVSPVSFPTVEAPEVDLSTLVEPDHILLDRITAKSPNGKHIAFVTAKSLGLMDSKLWMVDRDGQNKILVQVMDDKYSFFSKIAWNKYSTAFAFLEIYPTRIVIYDLAANYKEEIITKKDKKDNNLLNPSVGYQGESFLEWRDDNGIVFENNFAIPAKRLAINPDTKQVTEVETITETFNTSVTDSFFSQRDSAWQGNQLGGCSDETIGTAGCAIAAASMALSNLGMTEIDASKLNNFLSLDNQQGYVDDCAVKWYIAPSFEDGYVLKGAYDFEGNFTRLDYELSLGHQIVLGFDVVSFTNIPHWVLVVRKNDDGSYLIRDPWDFDKNDDKTLDYYGGRYDHMVVYEKLAS